MFSFASPALALVLIAHPLPADDLNPVTFHESPSHAPVVLVEGGVAQANICLMSEAPSAALRLAVQELHDCIKLTTGAEPEVVTGEVRPRAIIVGDCEEAAKEGVVGGDMPIDGFAIRTAPDRVFIVGHDGPVGEGTGAESNGTAWGVFEFLERFVDVRWYWPADRGGRSIVARDDLVIEPVWLSDAPAFRKREIWPPCGEPWHGKGQQLTPLHTKLRAGNSWPVSLRVHTPHWDQVPEYVEQRPECFQVRSDGTRNFAMLCYGNPRTLETYIENIARHFEEGEEAHLGIAGDAITVSPNDAAISCYCEDCRRLWDDEGGQYGTASRLMAEFVDKLAREVQQRWPDKTIIYLPYLNYTAAPDGYEFPDNVEVQLCGMPGIAQYKEPSVSAAEQANLEKWVRISGRPVQNWHYSCWPADRTKAPYQYPHVLQDYYRRNRDRLAGTFINGVEDHWPRHHVSLYCWVKLLWDPEFDVDAAIDEYCRRMYGSAAGTVRQLVALEVEGWEESRWPNGVLSPKAIYEVSYPRASVEKMRELLAQARTEAAGDEDALRHLDYFSAPFPEFFAEFESVIDGTGARSVVAKKVAEKPAIDGRLEDAAWQTAAPTSMVASDGAQEVDARYATSVQAVWAADGITFGFRMEEPALQSLARAVNSQDESMAWWDDCIEVFVDVTGENQGDWYQFILNANCAIYDGHGQDTSWNAENVEAAAHLGDDFWSLEVYVPYSTFPDVNTPGTGVEWYAQFTRHRIADSKGNQDSAREVQRLNYKFGGPSRNLADFAPLRFEE